MTTETKERTPAWFANPVGGKFGNTFKCDDLNGAGTVEFAINNDGDLSVTNGGATTLVRAKSNQYGPFYIVELGTKRYFLSRRTSKKDGSFYILAKEAIDRPLDSAGRPQRPQSYGTAK